MLSTHLLRRWLFSFEQCLQIATIAEIEKIPVPFLHINQLIQNKKAVNRPKDKIDVLELEKIKQLRKEMGLINNWSFLNYLERRLTNHCQQRL